MNDKFQADKGYYAELEGNFFKHLGYEYSEYLCDELDCQRADVENIPVPESLQQWFYSFHKQEIRKQRSRKLAIGIRNGVTKAAIIVLGFIGLNKILTDNVDAYRVTVQNAVLHMQEKFTQIDIYDDDVQGIPPNWAGFFYPTYIPDGYNVFSSSLISGGAIIEYHNEKGYTLFINQSKQSSALRIDTEYGEVSEFILDNGEKGYYLSKEDNNSFTFTLDEYRITIFASNLEYGEMIKISNSMEIHRPYLEK